ncbi:Hypothetical predicted protein [Octopus vulgaris]|uniref:Uncharacterized protein n=1 Tax=Octopus vulgaris TaxID=6645 RepID=A0AA36F3E0_OCTVU|nr:Hypothetical predicted protein [Octopus vulgaris]
MVIIMSCPAQKTILEAQHNTNEINILIKKTFSVDLYPITHSQRNIGKIKNTPVHLTLMSNLAEIIAFTIYFLAK